MPMREPVILVTNDDGIYSRGIFALQQAMRELGRTVVVAPETEKSAVGHAITIADPIRVKEVERENGFSGFAIGGTPADCVKLAFTTLLPSPPDLVVSGINRGANLGTTVLYSGTVSAATEGAFLGAPSIAFSLDAYLDPVYSAAAVISRRIAEQILRSGIQKGTSLNVNIPNLALDKIRGVKTTRLGSSFFRERLHRREDPRQRVYFWLDGEHVASPAEERDVDDLVLRDGWVTVTPLQYNLTDLRVIETFRNEGVFQDGLS